MSPLLALAITLSIPPAVKTLAVLGAVYGILQGLKKVPALTQYLTGTWAILFNVVLTVVGLLITIPADQLYTTNTLVLIVTTALGAAGIHGTIRSFSPPTVLAITPPDGQVKEVPATIEPINPADIPVDPKV